MNNELTEIILVVDRSGSMETIKDDMNGGIWSLVLEQRLTPGRCVVSMYTFDTHFKTSFEAKPVEDLTAFDCRIFPRGSTALFDAIVKALNKTEQRVLEMPETIRPSKVVVVVITDGAENASREVRSIKDVRKAIERATSKFGWQFVFMAADMDAFAQGQEATRGTSSSVGSFRPAAAKQAMTRVSRSISNYRGGTARSVEFDGED